MNVDAQFCTTCDGARLAFQLEGPAGAPVLILSHSLGCSREMWRLQMGRLTERFRVLRYDHRGHGQSSAPPGDYTLARLGQDVLDLMDGLGLAQAAFCGLSLGGMVGQWLGGCAANRFSRIALCNTAPFMSPERWETRIAAVRDGGMASIAGAVIAGWFTPRFTEADPDAVASLRATLTASDPQGYVGCCAAIRDMDLRPLASKITAPCLIIGGSEDAATPPWQSEWLAETITDARLVLLPAAHLSNVECSERFNDVLDGFLFEVGGP